MKEEGRTVTFSFSCEERESVELKIRLKYDNLKQGDFFRSLLEMYINQDSLILPAVDAIKERRKSMGKRKIKNSSQEIVSGKTLLEELGISNSDRQNMFDIIEGVEYE